MKNVIIIILAVAVAVLAMLHMQGLRSSKVARPDGTTVSRGQGQSATSSVKGSDQLSAQAEVAVVKSQLAARTTELEQRTVEKAKTEEQLVQAQAQSRQQAESFRKELEAAQQAAQQAAEQQIAEQARKIKTLETERGQLKQSLTAASNQLGIVKKKLSDLEKAHAETLAMVEKLRQQVMRLEMENASLQRRLNDLEALREQVRIVKQRLWDAKLAELKRQNEEGLAKGNRGFIMQDGRWTITAPQSPK